MDTDYSTLTLEELELHAEQINIHLGWWQDRMEALTLAWSNKMLEEIGFAAQEFVPDEPEWRIIPNDAQPFVPWTPEPEEQARAESPELDAESDSDETIPYDYAPEEL